MKASLVVRDHTAGQILNGIRYSWQAWRGFPAETLPYAPVWLDLLITSRCNLHCAQCQYLSPLSPRPPYRFPDMNIDGYLRILDHFTPAVAISLGGGEPLLHPELVSMVHQAHARRLKVHIPTNGTRLPRLVDSLLESPVEMLNVSLYGTGREEFAKLTGGAPSLFDATIRAAGEISARRRHGGYPRILRASFICTKANLCRVTDLIRLCERSGFDEVKLRNLHFAGIPGYGQSECLQEDDPQVQRFVGELGNHRFSIPVYLPRLYRSRYEPRGCTMPFRMLTIDGNGCIGPCCVEGTDPRFGNYFTERDVWNGPAMVKARRDLVDPSIPLPPACLHCEEMIPERRRL